MAASSYEQAGVIRQADALSSVRNHLGPTFSFPENAETLTGFGHYASVVKLSDELALAICTDGVGSKTVVASALDRYDTIAFDCVAMNVNDIICVGATPVAMVDYLGVHTLDPRRTDDILRGLGAAAKEAGIAVVGGELAQLPDVIGSDGSGAGDERAFDLVGTCVGTLHPDRLILGRAVEPGDTIIGILSSGIHSNGLSLARRTLLKDHHMALDAVVGSLGRTLGDELLEPTEIYVRAVTSLWSHGIQTRGLAHITGDGFANLTRLEAAAGYRIETLPERPAVFELIQQTGGIDDAEMFRVFNMGVGFVVIVAPGEASAALELIEGAGHRALRLGETTDEAGLVRIEPAGLVGGLGAGGGGFEPA